MIEEQISVFYVLIPGPTASEVIVRVRWILGKEKTAGTSEAVFPLLEDEFTVTLSEPTTGKSWPSHTIRPHPYVMLDPPRRKTTPLPQMQEWMPRDWADWTAVDLTLNDLRDDPVDPKFFYPLGVGHLLRHSSPSYVESQLRKYAEDVLRERRLKKEVRFDLMDDSEIGLHAAIFAALFRLAPMHPKDVYAALRKEFRRDGLRTVPRPHSVAWLDPILNPGIGSAPKLSRISIARRLAVLLQLLAEEELRGRAEVVAGQAGDMRGLMALRASQGGDLIDYWCDYDRALGAPSANCPSSKQGNRVRAAEALGLGTDFVIAASDAGGKLKVEVTAKDRKTLQLDKVYTFPGDGKPRSPAAGHCTMDVRRAARALASGGSSHPPPGALQVQAWVDYDFVSSFALKAGENILENVDAMMALAKPITGDGVVSIQILRELPSNGFQYDYPYNVYCIWDGLPDNAMQRYIDNPSLQPTLAELKLYLVTRRYSHRRDISSAFQDPTRIDTFRLVKDPPYEALFGLPDKIDSKVSSDDATVPYPPRESNDCILARLSFNLREIFPDPQSIGAGVAWERKSGALPDVGGTGTPPWTVESGRPATQPLPSDRMPQRYRLWVTAVDAFEQESDPIPVVGAEPGDDVANASGEQWLFKPRWRSPPPPAKDVHTSYDQPTQTLEVNWHVVTQWMIGTAQTIPRVPLQASIAVLRRPVAELQPATGPEASALAVAPQVSDLDPVLGAAVDVRAREGWSLWQTRKIMLRDIAGVRTESWQLAIEDRGYEYLPLIVHVIPSERAHFLMSDQVQVARYLVKSPKPDDGFIEERWTIPEQGKLARHRNYPGSSPVSAGNVLMVLPARGERPALSVIVSKSEWVLARQVLGVAGINRDEAMAKFIALADKTPPASGQLTTAQLTMLDATLDRLPAGSLGEDSRRIARSLLSNEFTESAGRGVALQHPVIGCRGVMLLAWKSTPSALQVVPTARFRVYTARAPIADDTPFHAATRNGNEYVLDDIPAFVSTERPVLVRVVDGGTRYIGLAQFSDTKTRTFKVYELKQELGDKEKVLQGEKVACQFFAGKVALELPAYPDQCSKDFEAALPIGGGYRESTAWWLVAVNCINDEQWTSQNGPVFVSVSLPATIMPMQVASLKAYAVTDKDADTPSDTAFDQYRSWLPASLPKEGRAIFPRTIVEWDVREIEGDEHYLVLERQSEYDEPVSALDGDDATWGMLKAIVSEKAGAFWNDAYVALKPWLAGGPSPVPPGSVPRQDIASFFSLGATEAWKLKSVQMLTRVVLPEETLGTFVDYFARPPSEGNQARNEPSRGEGRVRYRAYKLLDLQPGLPLPNAANWQSRFLVSEPSCWTGWVRAEWASTTLTWGLTTASREGAPLVRFTADYVNAGKAAIFPMSQLRASEDELFYRLTLSRVMPTAFGTADTSRTIGEMLKIQLGENGDTPVETADFSLERAEPGVPIDVSYHASATLVWRRAAGQDESIEEVLRMADVPVDIHWKEEIEDEKVARPEQGALIHVRVVIG